MNHGELHRWPAPTRHRDPQMRVTDREPEARLTNGGPASVQFDPRSSLLSARLRVGSDGSLLFVGSDDILDELSVSRTVRGK